MPWDLRLRPSDLPLGRGALGVKGLGESLGLKPLNIRLSLTLKTKCKTEEALNVSGEAALKPPSP